MKVLAMVSCLLLPSVAAGAEAAHPSPPKELEQLQFFDGDWTCEGQEPDTPWSKAHKTKTKVKVKDDLGGFWYSGKVDQDKTGENPYPMEAKFHWTYDADQKRFEGGWIDNSGGWAMQSSPGWQGDTMTWTGEATLQGHRSAMRDVITRKGDDEFRHAYEAQIDGQWKAVGEETCRRAKDKKKKKD